jgi:hypothetical protein
MFNILAVAIGDSGNDRTITDWSNLNAPHPVRPYIPGLMQGLAKLGRKIGAAADYIICYRERAEGNLPSAFVPPAGVTFHTFFCMSTTVARVAEPVAVAAQPMIPVVGIVSDPADEGFAASGNVCGISARRHQTAGDCLDRFVETVPTITTVYVMHKHGYGPSESALARIKARGARRTITVTELLPDPTHPDIGITNAASLVSALANLPQRNTANQPTVGLLVLPIDVCFANAATIINTAQGAPYNVPVFFPTPDWVKPTMPGSALGGYGVSQRTCGELLAERVDYALWQHAGQLPAPLPLPRFIDAPDASFEWWASSAAAAPVAANGLNITLGTNTPILS